MRRAGDDNARQQMATPVRPGITKMQSVLGLRAAALSKWKRA
jgi:hypothetical protein